jgi:cell wall-associated NlpC family hydrolase
MSLVTISSELVGMPYRLGGTTDALDCFTLIARYLQMRGITVPTDLVFKGHAISDYPSEYEADPKKMMGVAVDYIASITTEIPVHKTMAGDILFVQTEDNESLVVNGGNGTIIAATKERGTVVLDEHGYKIQRVFRCQPNRQ